MSGRASFLDAREARDPAQRERELFARLPAQVAHAKETSPYFAALFARVEAAGVTDRAALAQLPVTRKSQLAQLQRARLPFGGLSAVAPGRLARIFMSPGPIYDPEGRGADYWRTARALYAAGFREGDIALNCYSYHLSPAGSMFETGLHRLGCAVIPGGTGNTEQQARAIGDLQPAGYVGTPSFVKILLEKCDEIGIPATSVKRASVSGEALMPAVRDFLRARGVEAYQSYGTADVGLIAYETAAREGLVVDEDVIVEIVRPGTGDPVRDGEVGEVVVTTFSREYPLVRLATGDLSAVLAGASPCGRTNVRIKGWLGRADQSAKVRGLFVHPHQVAEVLRRHGVERGRLVIENEQGEDRMTFKVVGAVDARAMEASLRDVMKVRGEVVCVDASALPNDGKVIEDLRRYA